MKLFYILLILCLLGGCKSKRHLSYNSEVKQEFEEQNDIREHDFAKRDSSGQKLTEVVNNKESDSETETTIKTTDYDTSKPINPITGKPPILRETESTTRTNKKHRENTFGKIAENNNVLNQSGKDKIDLSNKTRYSEKTEYLEQEKITDLLKIPWLWIIIGVISVISLWYCIKKKINPLKWILRI